ncbi:MAG: hypothetical protein K0R50_968 [Eubacterium sp.]|jgi:hypothetical protein|nr:hypothetical protein [Eubacterium sp.]
MRKVKKTGVLFLALLMVLNSMSLVLPSEAKAAALPVPEVPQFTDFVKGNADAKPYMGWSTYSLQVYDGSAGKWISEEKIKQQSDAMHQKLQSHGYKYINIDAGWNGGEDEYGRPIPSETQYPGGFKNLVDYIHKNGQKIGIYCIPGISRDAIDKNLPILGTEKYDKNTDPGHVKQPLHIQDIIERDSSGNPVKIDAWEAYTYKIDFNKAGALEYIQSVADLFHEWGIDFVKLDSVTPGSDKGNSKDSRGNVWAWGYALAKYNIWLEISWAVEHNYADQWKKWANGWRVEHDVEAYDKNIGMTQWPCISRLFPVAALWWRDAGPGGWNDFDSLNVGNGSMDGLTKDERQTAATLWAISCAQFYTGDDMTKLDSFGLSLLTNDEVIAVDQGGHPAHPVSLDTQQQVWYSNNGDGTFNVAVFNLGSKSTAMDVKWSDIGLSGTASVRDLWSHTELGTFSNGISGIGLDPHASRLFKITANSGTAAINDDDTNITYNGNWTRNGGKEVAAQSQELLVTIGDSTGQPQIPAISGSGVIINDNDSTISYDNTFGYSSNREQYGADDYNDDVHYTNTSGGAIEYTFRGTGVEVITENAGYEHADIYLDGILVQHVDNTPGSRVNQEVLYSVAGLPYGEHTVKIVNTYTDYLQIDAIKVKGNSFISPDTAGFDGSNGIEVTPVYGVDSVTSIKNSETALSANIDYTVSGSAIVVNSSYLSKQQVGKTKLVFEFAGGAYHTLAVDIPIATQPPAGASSRYIMVNDNDPGISYNGKWGSGGRNADLKDYMGDAHYGETDSGNQPYFEYTFNGTGIGYYCELDPEQGDIDFYIDNVKAGTASSRCSGSKQASAMIWQTSGLSDGVHTFKAVKADSAMFMLFDALRVEVPNLMSPVTANFDKNIAEQRDLHIFLTGNLNNFSGIYNGAVPLVRGTDYTLSGGLVTISKVYLSAQPAGKVSLAFKYNGDFRNDVHSTAVAGDSFQYSFTGTGVSLLGPVSPEQGDMDIYIDGVLKQTVSAYSSDKRSNQLLYSITGLNSGTHTISGVKGTGYLMIVDQINFNIGGSNSGSNPSNGGSTPSNGGSNSGSGGSAPSTGGTVTTPATEAVKGIITGSDTLVTVNRTTQSDGSKKDEIKLTQDETRKFVADLVKTGKTTAVMTIDDLKDQVAETKVTITKEAVKLITDQKIDLEINTVNCIVHIPYLSLSGIAEDIVFTITPVKVQAGQTQIAAAANSSNIVMAATAGNKVTVVGRPVSVVTNLKNKTITLVLPLTGIDLNGSGQLGVYIEHSDGTKEYKAGKLVDFNSVKGLSFEVDSFSTFTIVLSDAAVQEHKAYVSGYKDGLFHPERKITRAEMAAILASALNLQEKADISYGDVKADYWAADAIAKVTGAGLMKGYQDNKFKPGQTLTRAEMAAIAAVLAKDAGTDAKISGTDSKSLSADTKTISDIADNWAKDYIMKVQAAGMMGGYSDGTFRPGKPLTRAEAVVVINRVLGRGTLNGISESKWKDVPGSFWAAGDIMEASTDHSFKMDIQGREQFVK